MCASGVSTQSTFVLVMARESRARARVGASSRTVSASSNGSRTSQKSAPPPPPPPPLPFLPWWWEKGLRAMILFYFWQTVVPILHRIAGESGGFKKKKTRNWLPHKQDQIDMSNKELQFKFIVNREDNRQMILARYNSYKKRLQVRRKSSARQKKKNPSRTQRQC